MNQQSLRVNSRGFFSQYIRKPGSVLADHLSSPGVATWIKRTIGELWRETTRLPGVSAPPCSRQGLPFHDVTTTNCELLPRSFHPCSCQFYLERAVLFLWHFP